MCTLSWKWSEETFHLFFNRDESRNRAEASEPLVQTIDGVRILAPIDPQGGGAWLGVNEFGIVVALVNDYQRPSSIETHLIQSRGQLVLDCLKQKSLEELKKKVDSKDLRVYPGFYLHAFVLGKKGYQAHWNAESLSWADPMGLRQPISSSSLFHEKAKVFRENLFSTSFSLEEQRSFHEVHHEKEPALSPWMEREDAKTQSYTELTLRPNDVEMHYGKTLSEAMRSKAKVLCFD